MNCPICQASWNATTIDARPCLCHWTEPQYEAVARLTRERDEAQAERDALRDDAIGIAHHADIREQLRASSGRVLRQLDELAALKRERDDLLKALQTSRYLSRHVQAERDEAREQRDLRHGEARLLRSDLEAAIRERDDARVEANLMKEVGRELERQRDEARANCAQFCGDNERLTKERDKTRALVRRLLDYRWRARSGYAFCNACGGRASEDEGRFTNVECSPSCPYAQAAALTEDDAHGG